MRAYDDVFTWLHEDIPGINSNLACHKLAVSKDAKPIKQKRKCFNQERYDAIHNEVDKILRENFIREVNYLEWIFNMVLVKKANGK